MKKHSLSLLLTFLSISVLAQWNYVGSDGISSGGMYQSIVTDASGNPVVVFNDGRNAHCLSYNGTQWDPVGNSTLDSFHIGEILDFDIDKDNQYYIAFRNTLNYKPSCIRFDGNEWKYVGSQYISEEINQMITMAVDTVNIVYIECLNESGSNIVKENADNWIPVTSSGITPDINFPYLIFDSQNVAYIVYTASFDIKCAKLVNDHWVQVGNSTIYSAYLPLFPKLNITKNHDLYIVFDNYLINCYKLNAQTNDWEILGVAGLGGNYLWSGNITSGSDSKIYISNEPMLGDRARCFSFDGSAWFQLGDSGISESYASYTKIAANNFGNLYAVYNDGTMGKTVVKEYAFPTGIEPVSFDKTVRMYPNPVNGILFVELPGQQFSVSIVDLGGKMVYRNTPVSDKVEIHTEAFGKGVYLVRLSSGKGTYSCRKLIVM